MAWRDRREVNQNYHERWSEVAREADDQLDRRPHRRTPGPVWDMRRSRSRSPDRFRDDGRPNRNDDRDNRFNRNDGRDRNDRYDRDNRFNRDNGDNLFNRRNDNRFDRHDRGSGSRDRDRYERDERRNNDREDRFKRDRDRGDRRDDNRYGDRNQTYDTEDVPNPPSPPKLTEMEKEEMRTAAEINRESTGEASVPSTGDWYCVCGSLNFKRRSTCYRRGCQYLRSDGTIFESQNSNEDSKSVGITKRLLFRRLDALTNEEKILDVLKQRVPQIVDSITGITIGRDALTGTSRGLAYLSFNSLSDSTTAHTALLKLSPHLEIDNRDVLISYCHDKPKSNPASATVQNIDYSAYYLQTGIDYSNGAEMTESDRINAAAAVAQSAITAAQARMWMPNSAPVFVANHATVAAVEPPDGKGTVKYSAPDVRTFMYDETSGYYYDASTGLYYDGTTQYFYNNQLNSYLYWDATNSTYYLATQNQQNTEQPKLPEPPTATAQNTIAKEGVPATAAAAAVQAPVEEKKKQKEDKVKVAKKIAKDMARWAKSLNQKKDNARSNIVSEQILDTSASVGSADIGFSVLGASGPVFPPIVREISPIPPAEAEFLMKNVEEVSPVDADEGIIDWSKLTCLLCKRRFPSADVLTKHKNMSDLHKQSLVEYCKNKVAETAASYRDRAAERRMKYGEGEEPVRKLKPPVSAMPRPVQPAPSVLDTVGGKMLQKMGWSEGKGLGRDGQGRTAPIEAEKRVQGAGLGQKRGIYTPTPGETYRDTVKKLAIARFNDILGDERE